MKLFSHPELLAEPDDEQDPAAVEVDWDEPVVARRRPVRIGYAMGVLLVVGVVGVASSPVPTVHDLGPGAGAEPAAPVVAPDLLTPPADEPPADAGVTIPVEPTEQVAPTSASPIPPVVLEIPLPTPADVSAFTTPATAADSTAATDPSATTESTSTDAAGSTTEYGSDGTDDESTASDGSNDGSNDGTDDGTDGSDTESDDQAGDVPDSGSDDVSDEPVDGSDSDADDSGDLPDTVTDTGAPGTTVSPFPVDPTAAPAAVGSTSSATATESCSAPATAQPAPPTPTALPC